MAKKRKKTLSKKLIFLYGLTTLLAIICTVFAFLLVHKSPQAPAESASPSISLGSMQYRFADGRATKRNDASVNTLQAFLENKATHERCSAQRPAYEHVTAYSKDETQVLLSYGCGATDASMYAVKVAGTWKSLSPTNHFDYLGIPDCDYLTTNNISSEIAPVCANDVRVGAPTTTPKYSVR